MAGRIDWLRWWAKVEHGENPWGKNMFGWLK